MKKTMKRILVAFTAFILTALITVCADIWVQYLQNYAAAPYVKADPSAALPAEEIMCAVPEGEVTPERAPYLLGWLRDEDIVLAHEIGYYRAGVQAKDARTPSSPAKNMSRFSLSRPWMLVWNMGSI